MELARLVTLILALAGRGLVFKCDAGYLPQRMSSTNSIGKAWPTKG